MELVMLGNVDKQGLLDEVDTKKKQERQENDANICCKIEIFNPMPTEGIVDAVVLKKLAEMKSVEVEKEVEKEKFKNAVILTDIPATIKKAGFYSDGSPKMAIAGLFDREVGFIVRDKKARYCSGNLDVVLAEVKTDWKRLVGLLMGVTSTIIALQATSSNDGCWGGVILIVGFVIPFLILTSAETPTLTKDDSYFTYLMLSEGKVMTKSNFYTEVPTVPESVWSKIYGPGPFAILFEVTQGWKKVETDPVIFRVINIGDQQFFEPLVGYDMTPLEKRSLVPV